MHSDAKFHAYMHSQGLHNTWDLMSKRSLGKKLKAVCTTFMMPPPLFVL